MPIHPNRMHGNRSTLNTQISPSDEASVFTVPIHAAAQLLPMGTWATERLERGHIFNAVFIET